MKSSNRFWHAKQQKIRMFYNEMVKSLAIHRLNSTWSIHRISDWNSFFVINVEIVFTLAVGDFCLVAAGSEMEVEGRMFEMFESLSTTHQNEFGLSNCFEIFFGVGTILSEFPFRFQSERHSRYPVLRDCALYQRFPHDGAFQLQSISQLLKFLYVLDCLAQIENEFFCRFKMCVRMHQILWEFSRLFYPRRSFCQEFKNGSKSGGSNEFF